MNDITWVFHAGDGRGRVLRFLVERYTHDLEPLLPRVESDDPLARLDAELGAEEICDETIAETPGLGRFFPPALHDLVRPRSSGATLLRARHRTG